MYCEWLRPRLLPFLAAAFLFVFSLTAGGCANRPAVATPAATSYTGSATTSVPTPEPTSHASGAGTAAGPYRPNTNGQIMVIVYHNIGPQEGRWERTPAGFRSDLQALYDRGYRPVNLGDLVAGQIDVPKGYSPVVITFDDGTAGQFRFITGPDGKTQIDPHSAMGVMLAFHRDHPDWPLRATFFVNGDPFQQPGWQQKLQFIVENGMEIGNHTFNHVYLNKVSASETVYQVGKEQALIDAAVPGYNATTLALPFGAYPAYPDAVRDGTYNGVHYHIKAMVLVGAGPMPSPFSPKFDPERIPRIQAADPSLGIKYTLPFWIDYFDRHPEARFVSDGTSGH